MKLICPSCGGASSAEAWQNDAQARSVLQAITEFPGGIPRHILGYLSLFRTNTGRGLRWSKALRLANELKVLVDAQVVSWKSHVDRPNHPAVWASALETITSHPPRRLPLTSHGYLRRIAYDVADDRDRAVEKKQIKIEHQDGRRSRGSAPERVPFENVDFKKIKMDIKQKRREIENNR